MAEKISFKPLHEGMGFHPFSDGLPYAPGSKSQTSKNFSNGAGANAAGRPQFASAVSNQPKVTARQIQQKQNQGNPATASTLAPGTIGVFQGQIAGAALVPPSAARPTLKPIAGTIAQTGAAKAPPKSQTAVAPTPVSEAVVLRKRTFAYILDTVIHAGFWLTTNLIALFIFKFQIDSEIVKDNLGQFLIFFLASQWIFIALQEILFENSIGKIFFDLEFMRDHKSLFLRSFAFMLGLCFFGLGLYFRPQDYFGTIQLKKSRY